VLTGCRDNKGWTLRLNAAWINFRLTLCKLEDNARELASGESESLEGRLAAVMRKAKE